MKLRNLIIGLGTGRCGTVSLSRLLSIQTNLLVTHEYGSLLPWEFSKRAIDQKIFELRKLNGDVAFYYLNYVIYINQLYPSTKFVCLRRDRMSTIESYLRKTGNTNNWMEHDGTKWENSPLFYNSFPKYNVITKEEALIMYYNSYYAKAEELKKELPENFEIFDITSLNSENGVKNILHFCGINDTAMKIITHLHLNNTV